VNSINPVPAFLYTKAFHLFGWFLLVGAALETSCQLEGMLESVILRERELQRQLLELQQLADGLRRKIDFEGRQPVVHPVIADVKALDGDIMVNDENNVSASLSNLDTPPKDSQSLGGIRPLIRLAASSDSTEVEIRDHHLLNQGTFVSSPAHSCPMPSDTATMSQPFLVQRLNGLPPYRVESHEDLSGLAFGFGCGSALFGERLIEHHPNSRDTDSLMALSFDDSLVDDIPLTIGDNGRPHFSSNHTIRLHGPHTVLSNDSPTRPESSIRSASFDAEPINFRTGMSGHSGLSQMKKKGSSPSQRRHVSLMSSHRGIAAAPRNIPAARGTASQEPSIGPRILAPPDGVHHIGE
jgi:hypothetical protein